VSWSDLAILAAEGLLWVWNHPIDSAVAALTAAAIELRRRRAKAEGRARERKARP
jgi:hypothetical protein